MGILKELLEASSWGKVSRREDFAPKRQGAVARGESLGKKRSIDDSRLGNIPAGMEKLAKAYGAYYSEERQGWYYPGRVPGELRDALRHSRG